MFLEFYGLNAQPFGVTPDPRYLYFSPGHREALASLFYGIETGRGFLALIAAPGMGKTTLLFQLLERLRGSARTVFLFQTQCDSREILHYIADGLGLDRRDNDSARLQARLNQFLLREAQAKRRVVLCIDEAQNLSDSVLETVRLLSDFEATDRKLLQIVLAGQPELGRRLLLPGLVQLRQRISVLTHLRPLPAEEIPHYINHRLQVAGYLGPELFTPEALALIAKSSQGVPRNINNICFSAMSLGFATGHKKIEGHTVREAIRDLSLDSYMGQAAALSSIPARAWVPRFLSMPFEGNWLKGPLIRIALVTTFLLVILVSGLAYRTGLGTGEKAGTPKIQEQAAIIGTTPRGDSHARVAEASIIQQDAVSWPLQTGDRRDSLITHVVQPRDTLWDVCFRLLGRYDPAVLAEIRELNRDLRDPNVLSVGQSLTLPRHSSKENAAPNSRDVSIPDRGN